MKTTRCYSELDVHCFFLSAQRWNYTFAHQTGKTALHTIIFVSWFVYLKASRRSTMWFVDVHSYKLPSPSGVFMEHLWHRGSASVGERTQTHISFKVPERKTQKLTLWLHHQKTSVTTEKKQLQAKNTQIGAHTH